MPETRPSITRYLNVKLANAPAFRSDGQRIAFLSDITGVPQVWQARIPPAGGEPLWPDQLTFEPDRISAVVCSPLAGDDRLIYARDMGGDENAQLFLLRADGATESCLTTGWERAMHIPGAWSQDGQRILFAANRRHPGLFDVYEQPLDGEARLVWQNDQPGFPFRMIYSPDGQRAAIMRMASSFSTDLVEVDLRSGGARLISPEGEGVCYFDMAYSADGESLLLCTDLDTDFLRLARLDPATQSIETLYAAGWDIEGMALSADGRTLAYAINVEGMSELYVRDLESGAIRQCPKIDDAPGLVMSMMALHIDLAPDASKVAFCYTSATRTQDIYVWDLQRDAVYPVTRSSHGGLPTDSFIAPELIRYPTFDHDESGQPRQIPAWFYRPANPGDRPLPVVVIVHGGPESQSRPMFNFLIQYLLHNGYAVFVPNVRGSTGYGKAYGHLDDVEKRMDSVADLAHGAYWLREQPGIDGERLVVYGGSYGGYMVLSAVTAYPDLWAAGVDIVGISSLVTFLENTSEYRRAHREAEYGSLERDRAFLESVSPINYLDRVSAPLMVIHGRNDPRVPLSETEQLVAALQARGVPVEYLVFDDEGHGVIKLKNKLVMYPAVIDFLNRHVRPG